MEFKYQSDFDELNIDCPPNDYVPKTIKAYRWVFDTMTHQDNFKSQYHKKPKRFNNKSDEEKCDAMALSMFDTVKNAKSRFEFLRENMRLNAYKILGTQIAEGQIMCEDGVNGKINHYGHFNHHPYIDRNYEQRFVIIDFL